MNVPTHVSRRSAPSMRAASNAFSALQQEVGRGVLTVTAPRAEIAQLKTIAIISKG